MLKWLVWRQGENFLVLFVQFYLCKRWKVIDGQASYVHVELGKCELISTWKSSIKGDVIGKVGDSIWILVGLLKHKGGGWGATLLNLTFLKCK